MTPLILERPGRWRAVAMAGVFALAVLPSLPLLAEAAGEGEGLGSFPAALRESAWLAAGAAILGFGVGLPLGVLTALYTFPSRRALLGLACLPSLVPSLLWAIGWSALTARVAPGALQGAPACVLVFATTATPLVLLTAWAATVTLGATQVEAARLAGGEGALVRSAFRQAAVPALLAAGLAGVLALSDPGPGQIFGARTAAAEILVSFSAFFDFGLAARQGIALAALVLVLAIPLAAVAAPRLAAAVLPRGTRPVHPVRNPGMAMLTAGGLLAFLAVGVAAPFAGLVLPALRGDALGRAGSEAARTLGNTLVYALGSGIVAAGLGLLLAVCAGRSSRLRRVALALSFLLLTLPPALPALGLLRWSGQVSAGIAPLFQSRLAVCLVLGLRLLPVAALLALRGWAATSPTWALAAELHGVPLGRYLLRVLVPRLAPAMGTALLLAALLATADVGTVLLVHPPGQGSLPLAIFTIMANAPEALVASLCLLYVLGASALLAAVLWLGGKTS
jgi:iron(III) transport system permease protein